MDWSRAKAILIVAFLFLDLFLGYQVYVSRTYQWTDAEAAQGGIGDLELLLQQQNISLEAEVPQQAPQLAYLNIEYVPPQELSNGYGTGSAKQEDSALVVTFPQPIPMSNPKNAEDLLRQLDDWVMYTDQYAVDEHFSGGREMRFFQKHNGLPIFVAYLNIYLDNGSVTGFKQIYLRIGNEGSGRQVISAYTAMRSLIEKQLLKSGEKIVDIALGYYGHEYDADVQVLAPVWRFVHSGQVHYVNAFTGGVEQPLTRQADKKQR